MNNKINSYEIIPISCITVLSMFFTFIITNILEISKNASILSFLIASIIGLIPLLLIGKIKSINDNKLINIITTSLGILILFIYSWLTINFIISQFLTRDSYYFIEILISITCFLGVKKNWETNLRTNFILFFLIIIISTLFMSTLTPYIKLDNLKPYINTNIKNILKSTIISLSSIITPMIYIINTKKYIKNKEKFTKHLLLGYLIGIIISIIFMFLIISVYGIEFSQILTYPFYAVFKKVQIFGFVERIENLAAIIFIMIYYIETTNLILALKDNIEKLLKKKTNKKENIILFILCFIIPLVSIYIFKNYKINYLLPKTPYILSIGLILIPLLYITKKEK